MSRGLLPVIWLTGAPGTGKSTTAWQLYTADVRAGRRVAYVDTDQLGMVYPAPDEDVRRDRIKGRAVGRVLRNVAAAGAASAIVSGVLDPERLDDYRRECHGCDVTFVRLTADRATLDYRLRARYGVDDVAAALALDARLAEVEFAGLLDTTGWASAEVAARVEAMRPVSRTRPAKPVACDPASGAPGIGVWVHGAPAIGKSSVAWQLFQQLIQEGGAGYLDLGQLSFVGRLAADHEALIAVQAASVAAVWDVFSATGARWLVISGALERSRDLAAFQRVLPNVDFRPVRLTASAEDLRARVLLRGDGRGPNLAGDPLRGQGPSTLDAAAHAAQVVARRLAASSLPGPAVDTTGQTVETTVDHVRRAVGI